MCVLASDVITATANQFFENGFNCPLFVSESTSKKGVYHLGTDINGGAANQKIKELMETGEQFPVYKYDEPVYSEEQADWTKPWDNRNWRWMSQYKLNTAPAQVVLKTYSLRFNKCHWLTVNACEDASQFMRADAAVKDGGLAIQTTNISSLTVALPNALVGGKPLEVKIDGAAVSATLKANGATTFYKAANAWSTPPPCRRRQRVGEAPRPVGPDSRCVLWRADASGLRRARGIHLGRQLAAGCLVRSAADLAAPAVFEIAKIPCAAA